MVAAQLGGERFHGRNIARDEDQIGFIGGEAFRELQPDAGGRAGD